MQIPSILSLNHANTELNDEIDFFSLKIIIINIGNRYDHMLVVIVCDDQMEKVQLPQLRYRDVN